MNEEIKKASGEIAIFSNEEFGQVRTTTDENGEVLVCLVDVCKVLDLDSSQIVRRLDKEVVSKHPLSTKGGKQIANFVNEDGFYDVVLESRKPNAKRFRKWVTSEVLPAIRKTGGYGNTNGADALRQITDTFADFVRTQQLANQVLLETLQALREDLSEQRKVCASPLFKSSDKPAFVVEVGIVPAGVRCVTDFLASKSIGFTLQYPLRGSFQVMVLDRPVEAEIIRELKDVIRNFTGATKWARVKTIEI